MRNSRSVGGGVDGRPSVLSCRAACLIPSVSPSLHHSPSTLTVPSSPSPSLSPIEIPPPRLPSVINPWPPLECSLYQVSLGHSPSASPCTTPNNTKPTQQQARPISQNQPVASTRPPVQVLHAAFRPDSVLLSLLASLVLPWHAAQRTHSFLLYIILPGTRQPTRASYKLTDANCSASAACVLRCVRVVPA